MGSCLAESRPGTREEEPYETMDAFGATCTPELVFVALPQAAATLVLEFTTSLMSNGARQAN